jgi:membrane associated rhomboid family serine protease
MAPSSAPVTRLLISAQVAVFLLAMFFALGQQPPIPLNEFLYHGNSPVLGWLAVSARSLAAGEWWRLLSYGLAHGGALHLLLNVIGHAVLGPTAERMFGPVRFLALWLLANLGGGCGAVLANAEAWTVGSSGALCGLIAAEAVFVWLNRTHLSRETMAQWQRGLIGIVLLNVLFSMDPRVSWGAHLGGAVVGLVAGGLLHYQRFGPPVGRWAALLGLGVLPVVCVATVYRAPGVADEMQKRREIADFNIRVVPEVQHVYRVTSLVCFEHADPLVRQPPIFREADQVRSALAALATLAEEQEAAGRLLAATGPYVTPQLEDARLIAEKFIQEVHELTGLYQQRLRAGAAWAREDEARMRRFGDEAKRWGALFHEPAAGAAVQ